MAGSNTTAGGFGGAYFFATVGAWVWFWQEHASFFGHLLALLQGLVWPGYVVYDVLRALR